MNELLHSLDWVLPLRSDALTPLMRFFTLLGYEKFILFFLPLGYWAWHRTVFFRLLVLVAITALLNAWLKDYWQDPRPDIALRMDHEVGESFGLPSGHAQISVVIWFWLALEVRRLWFWLLACTLVAGILFSRLYLGAHDVEDLIGGSLLGAATLGCFALAQRWKGWRESPALVHLMLIISATALAYFTWHGEPPSYVPLLAGLMIGVLYGYRHLDFSLDVAVWRRVLAAVIGALSFIGLQWALKHIGFAFSLDGQAWQAFRGLVMGGFVAALMPWLLLRFGLLKARRDEPSLALAEAA